MKAIQEIDRNFALKSGCTRENTLAYSVLAAPFSLHGLIPPRQPGDVYRRIPQTVAKAVSSGVEALHAHCAGGRVRFMTDSPYIGVVAQMGGIGKMPHFALTGSAGFDLYSGSTHMASFQPCFDITDRLFGEIYRNGSELQEYTLDFPLYSEVKDVRILLDGDAKVLPAAPYPGKPIVFYGSSITQGACASRPGTCYSALVARRLGCDHINLGFSGSAQGELAMAEHIAGLEMSAFIYDYDFNAPTTEHLAKTHEAFFQIIRRAHPEIPILCLNRPFFHIEEERNAIIRKTVENAEAQGDRNVYFLKISDYLQKLGITNEATVDRCHPNDLGFYAMAQAVTDFLQKIDFQP